MATCKYCKRDGFFLVLNEDKICLTCQSAIAIEVESRMRVMKESMYFVDHGKALSTRLLRCDVILEYSQALERYEKMGIKTTTPPPSEVFRIYYSMRFEIIKNGLKEETQNAIEKAKIASTPKAKINALSKVLLTIIDLKNKFSLPPEVIQLEIYLKQSISQIQLKAFLDEAQKAELKGNQKKALDQYYEAIYFLRHDDIDDSLQANNISSIEAKIKELTKDKNQVIDL